MLQEVDTIRPVIAPVVPGGLNNISVTCLSQVSSVGVPPTVATDNCEDSQALVPCSCCALCPQTGFFPCCDCTTPTQARFAVVPRNCNAAANGDETCVQTSGFPLNAASYLVRISNGTQIGLPVFVYVSAPAGSNVDVRGLTPLSRLAYNISVGSQWQTGLIQVNCRTFRRGEFYGSLELQGMNPGTLYVGMRRVRWGCH